MHSSNRDKYYEERINKANCFYHSLIGLKALRTSSIADRVKALEVIGYFNWIVHSGRYTSAFIDEQVKSISKEINSIDKLEAKSPNTVLFIATRVVSTGGHTRLIENIANYEKKKGNKVTLIITDQHSKLPDRIKYSTDFDKIIDISKHTVIDKIKLLSENVLRNSKVYNSQHPHDILPSIALNHANRSQTIYINHADHAFWVGANFCDCILNIRPFAQKLTVMRRTNKVPSFILPVKLNLNKPFLTKEEAKRKLGIPLDVKVLLTISDLYKIYPDKSYNFFEVINQILAQHKNVVYYLVGVNLEDYKKVVGVEPPDNLHLMGRVENPLLYQCAADFYLEGMPMNSLTALLESIYAGGYPVLMWGPYHVNMNMEEELFIQNVVKHSIDKNAYLKLIGDLLSGEKDEQITNEKAILKKYIDNYNSDLFWDRTLNNIDSLTIDKNVDYQEFATTITDLRISESWETFWQFKGEHVFYYFLMHLKRIMTYRELINLWQKYIFNDSQLGFIKKIKMLRRLLLTNNEDIAWFH